MNRLKKVLVPIVCLLCFQSVNARWIKQESGTLAWLHSVYFVDQHTGWVVGSGGTFLLTSDGGKIWRQGKKFTTDNIRDVYFTDDKNGWLLCEADIFKSGDGSPSYLLQTSNGGATWQSIQFKEGRDRIARIFFSNDGRGFGVGEGGAIWMMQDHRSNWKRSVLPVRYLMLDGYFADDLHGTLVGGGGTVLFTEDGGISWSNATLAGDIKTKFSSVFYADPRTGWAAGGTGSIYFTENGGKQWREQISGVTEHLSDVFFINANEGYVAGDNGTILSTTTAGNIWKREKTGVKHKLERIFFAGKRGFAVGFGGTILVMDN
ncbi:MAG: hypothetical protein H7070_03530 [Saprospiraceae bacterium]|nr:hypothetical protein [Pyrinomonadaceae bacterium]